LRGPGAPLNHTPLEPCQGPAPSKNLTSKGTARFTKADRLRQRRDFLRVQATGRRLKTLHFSLCLAPGATERPRLGLVVGRRLGKAVRRNRIKRLLREFFRRHKNMLQLHDIIIIAKKGAGALDYHQVQEELSRVMLPGAKVGKDD
jgi:ribonuclease P protein component